MRRNEQGFTMLEMMVAVSMSLVLSVIAVPMTANIVSNANLRSSAYSLATGMQMARMRAVNKNQAMRMRTQVTNGRTFVYIDDNNNGSLDQSEDQILLTLPRDMRFDLSGPGTPVVTGGATSVYTLPGFTTRGMPCRPTTNCATSSTSTFYVYLKQDRIMGQTGYAAVTISPAGRMQVWIWDNGTWRS